MPLVFELSCLFGIRPCFAQPRLPSGLIVRPRVGFRVTAVALAETLAQEFESRAPRLSLVWSLSLRAVDAGRWAFVLAPEVPEPSTVWRHDVRVLSNSLATAVRTRARRELESVWRGARMPQAAWVGFDRLTAREWEVLLAFLGGESAPTIARGLHRSVHTTRNHLKNIFAKLGVRAQDELRELFAH